MSDDLREVDALELGWKRRAIGHFTRTVGKNPEGIVVRAVARRSYPAAGGGKWTLTVRLGRREILRVGSLASLHIAKRMLVGAVGKNAVGRAVVR